MNYKIEVTKIHRYCYINAINEIDGRIGKICIDLDSEDSNRYNLANKKIAKIILVQTNSSACKQGIATSLLKRTIEEFKDYILYLNVIPLQRNKNDKTKKELISFYNKFGFKIYKDDICTTTMIKL